MITFESWSLWNYICLEFKYPESWQLNTSLQTTHKLQEHTHINREFRSERTLGLLIFFVQFGLIVTFFLFLLTLFGVPALGNTKTVTSTSWGQLNWALLQSKGNLCRFSCGFCFSVIFCFLFQVWIHILFPFQVIVCCSHTLWPGDRHSLDHYRSSRRNSTANKPISHSQDWTFSFSRSAYVCVWVCWFFGLLTTWHNFLKCFEEKKWNLTMKTFVCVQESRNFYDDFVIHGAIYEIFSRLEFFWKTIPIIRF